MGEWYRDAQGRITARFKNTLTNWNAAAAGDYYYGYTASGDTPDFVRDVNWAVSEKNLQLPGGVLLTIRPQQTGNAQKQYSLPNIHGDILLTTDAVGTNTSNGNGPASTFTYDPFGNILSGSTYPSNADHASYGWVGQHEKLTESEYATTPMQMGARVYIPGIARFLQVDPVEGGTENSYVYPTDPVNEFDLSGNLAQRGTSGSRGSALSGTDQWILDRYKGGLKLTKQELKRAKQLIRTTVKSDLKFKKIRPSRQTKDLIKKAGKYSKGFIFIFIPKPITDGLQPKSTGPSA